MPAESLFPDIRPFRSQHLDVDPPHRLYLEECGISEGIPVVFLHGGPGSGCESWHRRFFDPNRYRIVLFDQRGCGRSVPHASLERNTTWDLVSDMERIREHLGIDRWVVFGGSWGSTLALAYAQAHPDRVLGLVLRGIFLCRDQDIHWFYQDGAGRLFPDYWEDYLAPIPEADRGDMVAAYYRRLTGTDEVARMAAAKAWSEWEGRTATLLTNPAVVGHFQNPFTALSLARIECHYFRHQAFLEPDQLLRDAHLLAEIPGYIIHGRYDVVCPVDQAWALHQAWPRAELCIVPDAGHSAGEPGIARALVAATQALADRLT
ncbi:prolyl aminopeptidase [Ectothiorhodospira shaposhnikovii]|uniref:prolyl aminopeptidase n=1 Tax=Ectothiorhodospira shaposhnikovii TaxID=1054 RepID=UPI0019071F57|nr:prolyl aminopeptidase [Ectothiorhodospira shaposhnikovii]MBK1672897.1 prolyl aminopeptidase [Ectothiorhodospira shaposhnikovii]